RPLISRNIWRPRPTWSPSGKQADVRDRFKRPDQIKRPNSKASSQGKLSDWTQPALWLPAEHFSHTSARRAVDTLDFAGKPLRQARAILPGEHDERSDPYPNNN